MGAARASLVLALVASATQTGRAEPCAPRAQLGGDAEAVARVAVELQRLGVEVRTDASGHVRTTSTRASCPVIVAAVELERGGGIAVAVRDATQRSEGRVVSDAALAAAWIDSWLRDDFAAPLVEAPPLLQPPALTREAAAPEATPAPPLLDQFSLAASFLQVWSGDRTRWLGVAASACVRAGELCIGGRLGFASQDVTADFTAAAKRDLSLLATASYSQEVGHMSFAPELGLGVGRLTTSRIDGCKPEPGTPLMCDPMTDPSCDQNLPTCTQDDAGIAYVGDNFSASTYTPRVSAALRIAIPLFDHVWLDGLAAATLAPFAHTAEYSAKNPDGTTAPNTGNVEFPLPGDPLFGIQLGVGLRVGAR